MFDEKGKRILIYAAIPVQTQFIGGYYTRDIICCIKVRPALMMFLADE